MELGLQFKLKQNPIYLNYLRENSYWYKILNRNPYMYDELVKEAKKAYGLRPTDKINKAFDTFNLISSVFSNM
ncbi:MAG: YlbE-like family protein [Mycoplasmatota bacterium]